jgi:hypothetical protein
LEVFFNIVNMDHPTSNWSGTQNRMGVYSAGIHFAARNEGNGQQIGISLDQISVTVIPEPGTLILFALAGVAILVGLHRRKG